VAAALVLRDGAAMPIDEEFVGFCRPHLAHFKTPKRWIQLPALPMTPVGKVRKFQVRDAILGATAPVAQP
jgi:acyl-CoA synthetase (AMP-forming)/AMP-acid ligase II